MTIAHSVLSVSFGRKVRRPAAEQIHDAAAAPAAPTSKKVAVVITRALSVTRTDAEGSTLIEKICDSSLEAGECFFCTGPETD